MSTIENLDTYINRNGYPMIRRCQNCVHWKAQNPEKSLGLCTFKPYFFAFTLQQSVYPLTKNFVLCENHHFENESKLAEISKKVKLKDVIKKKDDIR